MKTVFADSSYYFALSNPRDASHRAALAFHKTYRGRIFTTGWVYMELADGYVSPDLRSIPLQLLEQFRTDPSYDFIPCSDELMLEGVDLFRKRPDKLWSLTDCISFVVMDRHKIIEALTADHHFEQGGYVALLKPAASS